MSVAAERTEGDRAAAIVVDAQVIGTKATAKRWGVSERTVRRYQARARVEPVLGAAVAERAKDATKTWLEQTSRVRQRVLAKLDDLVGQLGPEATRELVQSVLACRRALDSVDAADMGTRVLVEDDLDSQYAALRAASEDVLKARAALDAEAKARHLTRVA